MTQIGESHPTTSERSLHVLVTSVSSDAHTWNLVYLQLLLEGWGHRVTNLGACVPVDLLVSRCVESRPDVVVMSSVNGHGWQDGQRAVSALREHGEFARVPVVIGGKLGIDGPGGESMAQALRDAGFDAVFDGSPAAALRTFLDRVPEPART